AALAEARDVRLHTHLGETPDDAAYCLRRHNMHAVDYLRSVGWLGPRTWLAHGIHFSQVEIDRLGRAGVGICHCPSANMRLGNGICRTLQLEGKGATIGLGVDGSASNDASNLLLEARQALYLQRLRYGAEAVTPEKVLGWATRGSARLLGRGDIGELAVGKQADLALFRLDELRFSGSHDPLAALLLCGAERADRVMVGGRWRVVDGQIEGLDLAALIAAHRQAARQLIAGWRGCAVAAPRLHGFPLQSPPLTARRAQRPAMSATFVHLRLHTEFSLVDGLVRIKPLVKATAAAGMPAVAVTEIRTCTRWCSSTRRPTARASSPSAGPTCGWPAGMRTAR